jgi:hypothetical protein
LLFLHSFFYFHFLKIRKIIIITFAFVNLIDPFCLLRIKKRKKLGRKPATKFSVAQGDHKVSKELTRLALGDIAQRNGAAEI